MQSITVHPWPACPLQLGALTSGLPLVFAVPATEAAERNKQQARARVRSAIEACFAQLAPQHPPLQLPIQTGKPWWFADVLTVQGNTSFSLSISHSSEFSLFAVQKNQAVGVDVYQYGGLSMPTLNAEEIERLATDYLGKDLANQLKKMPHQQSLQHFARAWVNMEAGGKCLGFALTEWSAQREQQFSACTYYDLDFTLCPQCQSGNWLGSVAVAPAT